MYLGGHATVVHCTQLIGSLSTDLLEAIRSGMRDEEPQAGQHLLGQLPEAPHSIQSERERSAVGHQNFGAGTCIPTIFLMASGQECHTSPVPSLLCLKSTNFQANGGVLMPDPAGGTPK
jgi:hypothetical protein